jgi:putative lipoprotein
MNILKVRFYFIFIVLAFLAGCSTMQKIASVEGSVAYLERMALPPSAQLEITLADVSLADAPYQIISQKKMTPIGQVPIPFVIEYDPQQINPSHTYAVMARITVDGKLMFINDRSYQVITRDQTSKVEMILKRVAAN